MNHWILINYNCEEDIDRLIGLYNETIKFIVVDNSGTFQSTKEHIYLNPQKNLGYIGGLIHALENHPNLNNFIFSNADISLDFEPQDIFNESEKAVIIPSIILNNGRNQNPHCIERPKKRYWDLRLFVSSKAFYFYLWNILRNLKEKANVRKTDFDYSNETQNVYAGHGSFFVFNEVQFYELIKNKDFNFLFGEEVHIAETLSSNKIPMIFKSKYIVRHYEHSSTSMLAISKKQKYYHESYISILDKYY